MVGGLVTNAIKHCAGDVTVALAVHRDWVEVAGGDDSPDLAEVSNPHPHLRASLADQGGTSEPRTVVY